MRLTLLGRPRLFLRTTFDSLPHLPFRLLLFRSIHLPRLRSFWTTPTFVFHCWAGVGGQGKPLRRWKATQRWHVRQQEAPARTRPSALYFIGTLSQTLTLRAAFSSSTYLLPQIPGPGRSSDDDLQRNLQITEYQAFNQNQSWIFGNSENA